ncbi:MAG: nucleotidyltransferase domain-containing protein [Clostridia bacterium]|nr:nucleotidyltransferase domain-containing protein [Clostridia bacterium]
MPNTLKSILTEYVKGILDIVGDNLDKVILFGSYVKNNQNSNGEISDIDIMILVNIDEENIKNLETKILDYSYDMDLKHNILLSPIVETVNNYNNRIKYMPFYQNVEKEGVILSA